MDDDRLGVLAPRVLMIGTLPLRPRETGRDAPHTRHVPHPTPAKGRQAAGDEPADLLEPDDSNRGLLIDVRA